MITIHPIAFHHVHTAAMVQFHAEVVSIIENEDALPLFPADLLDDYRANIAHYPKLNWQRVADKLTAEMESLDEARDWAYRVIRLALSAMQASLDDELRDYYETHIAPLFAAFWDFSVDMDYSSETASLRSFCSKLKALDAGILARAYVSARQIDDLADINERFEAAYVQRTDKRAKRESAKALARTMEEQWQLIASIVTAAANEVPSGTDDGRVERFRHLAGSLNEHVDYYRTHHAARKKTAG